LSGLRAYYLLVIAQAVSLLGSQLAALTVSIDIFKQTGQATPVALVAFFSVAPAMVLSGLAGAMADRFSRRGIMLAANLGFIATNSLLLLSYASGAFELWHLYTAAFANGLFVALERPAFQASIAMLVPDSHRDRANAIAQMTSPAAGVIAPALAGLLYALIGVVGALTLNISSFVLAIVALSLVRIPMPAETDAGRAMRASIWRQYFDGFRFLLQRPALISLVGYISVANLLINPVIVLQVPYILTRLNSEATLGLVMGIVNAGATLGAVAMGVWGGTRPRIHTVLAGIAFEGFFLALGGLSRDPATITASLFMFMFAIPFVNAAAISILQAKVPPDLQGRVFASLAQIAALFTPVAFLMAGPLADRVFEPAVHTPAWQTFSWLVGAGAGAGIGLMFVIGGALTILLTIAAYALPIIRRVEAVLPDHRTTAQAA
jgi:MFS transporter, DHA3 family, macrolide efflux protein